MGVNKKTEEQFKRLNSDCVAVIDKYIKSFVKKMVSDNFSDLFYCCYIEIQGDDDQLIKLVQKMRLSDYVLIPMESVGFLKYKLGILQFFPSTINQLYETIDLWDTELFIRISYLKQKLDIHSVIPFSEDFLNAINQSKIIITQSGDEDEAEFVFNNDEWKTILFTE